MLRFRGMDRYERPMNNTVLVVDDESVLAGAMRDYLGRHGYAVQVKSSGEEALKTIDLEPPRYRCPRLPFAAHGWTGSLA
jgi:ActR/RegA family two-component response regulator